MTKINNTIIVKVNNRTKAAMNGRIRSLDSIYLPDAMTVSTTFRDKYYSARIKMSSLRESYGKAVKSVREHAKRI